MDDNELKNTVEALLFSANEPLTLERIQEVFDETLRPDKEQLQQVMHRLASDYAERPLELRQSATGYLLQTKSRYSEWIARLYAEKPVKYSRALLETLAIIAYRQPVTRGDIEALRGVAVNSQIIKTLLEREWIRIAGYKDVAGKPAVFTTTSQFLTYFNLKNLHELPFTGLGSVDI